MRFLRLIVAGLVAIAAMVAVFLAAAVVFFTGLVAFVLQLFGVRKNATPPAPAPAQSRGSSMRAMRTDDAIDVETTKVPEKTVER